MSRQISGAKALLFWVREYKGGRVAFLGYPRTNILDPSHGGHHRQEVSKSKTLGDIAQDAYMHMLNNGYRKQAVAVEIALFCPEMIWEDKQRALRAVGVHCDTPKALTRWTNAGIVAIVSLIETGKLPEFEAKNKTCIISDFVQNDSYCVRVA